MAHPSRERTYLWASVDQNDEQLNSRHRYKLVMRPTDVSKVEAFWPFTSYQDFNLMPNEVNRRAIRENNKVLKREADVMLRIAI